MSRLVRVLDPNEKERTINLVIKKDHCPGLLEFLAELPYRSETPIIRGVFYQWFKKHHEEGTLDAAIDDAYGGPGGYLPSSHMANTPRPTVPVKGKTKQPRQRTIAAPAQSTTPKQQHNAPAPKGVTPSTPLERQAEGYSAAEVGVAPPPLVPNTDENGPTPPYPQQPTAAQMEALLDMGNSFP